jgi:hypothetical protein
VFRALITDRLLATEYQLAPGKPGAAPPDRVLRILQCTRLLLRDRWFVRELVALDGGVDAIAEKFRFYAARHFSVEQAEVHTPFHAEILSEIASIFKKLASDRSGCPWRLLVGPG